MGRKSSGRHAAHRVRSALLAAAVPAVAAAGIAVLTPGGSSTEHTPGLRLTGAAVNLVTAIPPTPRPSPAPAASASAYPTTAPAPATP